MAFIKQIIQTIKSYFRRHKDISVNRSVTTEQNDGFDSTFGATSIESYYDLHRIPGTTLDVGTWAKVLQTPNNEIITLNQEKGVRAGCGHPLNVIDTVVTEIGTQYGIGGFCYCCAKEAAQLLNQGLVSSQQAQELSIYCSRCAGRCDICRRRDLCLRHSQRFEDIDGRVLFLCPDCLAKAEQEKFLKKAASIMFAPFIDHKQAPPSRKENDYAQ